MAITPRDIVSDETPIFGPEMLVRELLMARTEELPPAQLAAFVAGWASALELVGRSDLLVPDADPLVARALVDLVALIQRSMARGLDDQD